MMMIYPAIALLHNQAQGRWHPILFSEAPFPGSPEPNSPIRLRSRGHHTEGFASREDALEGALALAAQVEPAPAMFLDRDLEWDGLDVPAMHLLCGRDANGTLRLLD